jgi:hypothetical protein
MTRARMVAALAIMNLSAVVAYAQAPVPTPTAQANPAGPGGAPAVETPSAETPAPSAVENGAASGPTSIPDSWAGGADLDAERKAIWTSPEMVEALEYIRQYSLRSRAFTPEQAQQYVSELRQLSPGSMAKWLEKFRAMQSRRLKAEEVARAARQTAVEESVRRLQMAQESYSAAGEGASGAALNARNELARQQQFRDAATAARRANRNAFVSDALTNPYDWIINPDWYTKWAASASLPGDLPSSDPRNFIRGDVIGPDNNGPPQGSAGAVVGSGAAGPGAAAPSAAPPVPTPGG